MSANAEPVGRPADEHEMATGTSPKHEIGILFVHGIGEQKAGQTLVEFGEPICQWITQWLDVAIEQWTGSGIGSGGLIEWVRQQSDEGVPAELLTQNAPELQIIDQIYSNRGPADQKRLQLLTPLLDWLHEHKRKEAWGSVPDLKASGERYRLPFVGGRVTTENMSLSTTEHIPEYPMSATLGIEVLKADGEVLHTSWKLAESHWADSFLPPKFLPMALWVIVIAPWTAGSYFTRRICRRYWVLEKLKSQRTGLGKSLLGYARLCGLVLAAPLALPMAFLTQISMGLLWLLWLPPVPALRRWSARFQQKLVAVLGDAHAFAASPLREAAIIDQVMRDLRWLEERCEKIVIVAHSQGAAIAYLCLRKWVPASVRLVVTFGSGMRKLEEFYKLRRPGLHMVRVTFVLGMILYYVVIQPLLSFAFTGTLFGGVWGWGWIAVWIVCIAFYLGLLLGFTSEEENRDFWAWAQVLDKRKIRWLDIFSTADPVPNGPIFIEKSNFVAPGALESVEVNNFGSVWADHTSYMRNRDEFLGTLVAGSPAIRIRESRFMI